MALPGAPSLILLPRIVIPGSQVFTSSGTFIVPEHNQLIIKVYGAGAGGAGGSPNYGDAGGNSSFDGSIIGGGALNNATPGWSGGHAPGGSGGSASGGDTNTTGNTGEAGNLGVQGIGAAGLDGYGAGGNADYYYTGSYWGGGGGGSGGRAIKTVLRGVYAVGASVSVVVGLGGAPGAGELGVGTYGANGRVEISWT